MEIKLKAVKDSFAIGPTLEDQKELERILEQCRGIKDELLGLPSCKLSVGQLLRLADCELFGLSSVDRIPQARELLKDFQDLRDELIK